MPEAEGEEIAQRWRARLGDEVPVVLTSSATRAGLAELSSLLLRTVPVEAPVGEEELAGYEELAEHRVFRPAAGRAWSIERGAGGIFRVSGEPIERLFARFDVDNEEALAHVERRLKRMGVIRALEEAGFQPGDDVEIAGIVFELDPS